MRRSTPRASRRWSRRTWRRGRTSAGSRPGSTHVRDERGALFRGREAAYPRRMRTVLLATLVLLGAPVAGADPGGAAKESARTAGHAARDGAETVGRTVRDFFTHGPRTAKRTWKANAAR